MLKSLSAGIRVAAQQVGSNGRERTAECRDGGVGRSFVKPDRRRGRELSQVKYNSTSAMELTTLDLPPSLASLCVDCCTVSLR